MSEFLALSVNGEVHRLAGPITIAGLLRALSFPQKGVAVELNREIVPRSAFETTLASAGDCIEVVQFVGGG
jgi:thiamine biosynthesis protein ThiS